MKTTLSVLGSFLLASMVAAQGSDDRAVPRGSTGGGSSSGGSAGASSSDAGSRHTGSGSGSSASSGDSTFGWESSSIPSAAQRRPQPGTGTGDRYFRGRTDGGRYEPYAYSGYYYDPYAYSFGYRPNRSYFGYGYYDYGYSYGDYYGYYPQRVYRYREGNIAQLRVIVEPAKARVYVDGYYAGVADDYDGIFQRLTVSPGRHDITLKYEGYKTHTFKVYANRDQTLKLRYDMVKGSGDSEESLGEEGPAENRRDFESNRSANGGTEDRRGPDGAPRYVPPTSRERGTVSFEITPDDASIYVDGEFYGKAGDLPTLELPVGTHRVEIVRPGYKTDEREIRVEQRRNEAIRVRLEKP